MILCAQDEVDWHPEELVREMEEFMQMELDTIQSLLDDSQIGRQLQDIMDNMMMLFTPMPGGLAAAEPSSTSSGTHRHLLRERAHHILSNSSPRKLLKSGATADEKWTALDDSITQQEYDGGKEEDGAAEVYLLDGEDPTKYDDMKISELMDLYPSEMEVELLMGVEPEYSWSLTLPATEEDDVEVDEDVEASTKSLLDLDVSDLMVMQPHAVTGFEGQLDLLEDLIEATKMTMARLGDAVAMGIEATDGPIYLDTLWLDIFPDNYDMAPPPSTSPMHSPSNVPGYADNVVHTTVAATEVPHTTTTFAPVELREDKATTARGVMMSA
jgi:hypothetical protein